MAKLRGGRHQATLLLSEVTVRGAETQENWAGEKGAGAAPHSLVLLASEADSRAVAYGGSLLPLPDPRPILLLLPWMGLCS